MFARNGRLRAFLFPGDEPDDRATLRNDGVRILHAPSRGGFVEVARTASPAG